METRLEINKRRKKRKRIKRLKIFLILILIGFMVQGLMIVNQNIIELKGLDNPTILNFDFKTMKLEAFGKTYIVDLKILKESD